jgi:CHASE3 domain sensor protein
MAVAIIVLLVGHIIYATLSSLEKAEDNYRAMRELKGRAEAADVAKSQVLSTPAMSLSYALVSYLLCATFFSVLAS